MSELSAPDRIPGVAIVTGAASGIGLAAARLLAERGARVILADRDAEALEDAAALIPGGVPVICDVSDPATPAMLVARAQAQGGLSVLVNNAGIAAAPPIARTTDEDFERFIAVNVASAFRLCREALPAMAARGTGAVVNHPGAWAWLACPRIYALTCNPRAAAASSDASTSAAAPSEIEEAFAAVTVPFSRNAGFSVGILSGRADLGCSSASTTTSPLRVFRVIGAISPSNAPLS